MCAGLQVDAQEAPAPRTKVTQTKLDKTRRRRLQTGNGDTGVREERTSRSVVVDAQRLGGFGEQ